jgi:hypothetical protein
MVGELVILPVLGYKLIVCIGLRTNGDRLSISSVYDYGCLEGGSNPVTSVLYLKYYSLVMIFF